MDRLDTGPVNAAGGDVLKGSDGDRMGLVVEARAVPTGKLDGPLRPTLRQDEARGRSIRSVSAAASETPGVAGFASATRTNT